MKKAASNSATPLPERVKVAPFRKTIRRRKTVMADYQELFDCSICLQQLKDPVTTACGHSYCMSCINSFWDQDAGQKGVYSCPQCRQAFRPRPALKRNTLVASLLEKRQAPGGEERSGGAAAHSPAAPGEVDCDACTGTKRKAAMFCLVCMAAYCETHLSPHFEVPPLRKHRLVQASQAVQESICCRHDKLLELYCRTDRQCICLLCAVGEHKGHDTVSAAAEKTEKKRELEAAKQQSVDRMHISEQRVKELNQAADSVRAAAWETVDHFERVCMEHIRLYIWAIERKCAEMRAKVGETEKAAVDCASGLLGQLQREASELRRRQAELNQLSLLDDPVQFLKRLQALDELPESSASPRSLETATKFITAQKSKLEKMRKEEEVLRFPNLQESTAATTTSRRYLLDIHKNYKLEVDPNTVAACLHLSDNNRVISWGNSDQAHPTHPDRFTFYHQALCKDGLADDHYWEVEWDSGVVEVAVSYRDISRKGSGNDCAFGHNNMSWSLVCSPSGLTFWHNNNYKANIPPPHSRKVGVYLNYRTGNLYFYGISDSHYLTCLHQIQTTFTQPLYPGFCVDVGATLKLCKQ
ncbi:E3 ubiquitin/ISG15 ligase TRIM25-like isoform X2 [Myripristis murdjan]|uniref:E3 ubiquitin/ISG15 ligase TRIM25-like isoform X2 n=1 Tax=Myripristis murdjan TaxID=586833 RepID=UPI001175E6C2|nr:E3 ubiquitin/ISG15 ligase TRIM25-like isoform X2 [Myripristis murdjan]